MSRTASATTSAAGASTARSCTRPVEAIRLLKDEPAAKFDETIEVHMNLGLNVRHADEQLRGTLMLPHGTGRKMRVAVFAEGEKAREAEEAGADVVGSTISRSGSRGLHRLRRRRRDAGHDGQRRPARPRARPARTDAEPQDRHRHDGRRQGRQRLEGRPARVPHRPWCERARPDRQEVLRREGAPRELLRGDRRDRPREAGGSRRAGTSRRSR